MPFEAPHTRSIHDITFPRDVSSRPMFKQRAEEIREMTRPINFNKLGELVEKARAEVKEEEEQDDMDDVKGKGKEKRKRVLSQSPSAHQTNDTSKKFKLERQDSESSLNPEPKPSLAAIPADADASSDATTSYPLFAHSFTYSPLRPAAAPTPAEDAPGIRAHQRYGYGGQKPFKVSQSDADRQKVLLASYKERTSCLKRLFPDHDPDEDEPEHPEEEEERGEDGEKLDLGEVWLYPSQEGKGGGPLVLRSKILGGALKKSVVWDETIFQCEMGNGIVGPWVEGSDFRDRWSEQSWFNALSLLASSKPSRLAVSAHLSIQLHKSPNSSPAYFPFTFHLTIQVSLPSSTLTTKCPSDLLEAQRLLFTSLLPPPPVPEAYAKHEYETTLPFFYEVLQPSPPFQPEEGEDEQTVQSPLLQPTLMPFQRRSVKWLLGREGLKLEGKDIVEKEEEGSKDDKGQEIWWEEVGLPLRKAPPFGWESEGGEWVAATERGGRKPWWNRLTGGIVADEGEIEKDEWAIDLRDVYGGMLCEEMGLGKTLEVISLLLLSPKESDAYLGEVVWNKDLEISYRACTATLIVAPPTLTQQWADELAQHAPSLKVLIYDGYKKLPFQASAGKKEKKPKQLAQKRQKVTRTTFRGIPLPESDEEEEDEDDEQTGEEQFWAYLEEKAADVVITTYNVLQQDFAVVKRGAGRPRRSNTEYADHLKPRSPLVMIEWERVCMDEVQMQGDGKAAEMVGLIPRRYSLAVSGTPARNATKDLQQALKFLRVPILAKNDRLWNRLLAPTFASMFAKFFSYIATRTTKVQVAAESKIPPQTRMIFPVDHTNTEQMYYQDTLSRALQDLGFDNQGNGFELDLQRARTWIHTLRQIATHLQVGNLQNNNGGRQRQHRGGAGGDPARDRLNLGAAAGNLLDLKDVLQRMMDQKLSEIWGLRLQMLKVKTNHAIYLEKAQVAVKRLGKEPVESFAPFFKHPISGEPLPDDLALLTWVINDAQAVIADFEGQLAEIAAAQAETRSQLADPKGKGKARALSDDEDEDEESSSSDDEDDEAVPRTDAERATSARKSALSHRLRDYREALHRATFFLGDYWHVSGDKEKEDASYAEAEAIRRKMLQEPEQVADAAIKKMTSRLVKDMVTQEELEVSFCEPGGIQTNDLCEQTDDVLDILNSNYQLVWNWRGKVFTLLSSSLVSIDGREKDSEGNEYALALEQQIEVEAFLEAYVNAVADRREILTENRSQLADLDARNVKKRSTKRANAASQVAIDLGLTRNDPERDALRNSLREERDAYRLNPPGPKKKGTVERKCLKSQLFELREVSERALNDMELEISKRKVKRIQKVITDQTAILKKLEEEIGVFRQAFNERVLFFAQYQAISDSVTELVIKNDIDLRQKLEHGKTEQQKITDKLVPLQSNVRYMETIKSFHEKVDEGAEEDRECVICREELVRGVLFGCSHLICEDCYTTFKQQIRPECPYCRTRIIHEDVHRVLLNPQPESEKGDDEEPSEKANTASSSGIKSKGKAKPKPKGKGKESSAKPTVHVKTRTSSFEDHLNIVPAETRAAVIGVSIFGSWGSKIDMMIKCLLHLRAQDPKSKAVVFSAFADALTILERAMAANGIKFVSGGSTDRKAAHKFAEDDSIQCFLLKAEREAAGLTLTSARYVLLTEPTVNPSFELQAIGRVDRISQKNETTVFCFQTTDTIDENIVKLQLTKNLSIFKSSTQTEVFSTNATRRSEGKAEGSYKKAGADFIKKSSDLASLLFPELHLRHYDPNATIEDDEDEEGDEEMMGEDEEMEEALARSKAEAEAETELARWRDNDQPVAGPSRLG